MDPLGFTQKSFPAFFFQVQMALYFFGNEIVSCYIWLNKKGVHMRYLMGVK